MSKNLVKNNKKKKFSSVDQAVIFSIKEKRKRRAKHIDQGWWWASELGLCKRRQFLRRKETPISDPKPVRIDFLAEIGKATHNWIGEALSGLGIVVAKEGKIRDEKTRFSGRFDLLVWLDGILVLVDVKTQRAEAFFYRSKTGVIKYFQKIQLASYFYFLKKKYPKLSEARLYFLDRSGGCRDEYVFKFDKKILKKVLKELSDLNNYWKKDQLPPKVKGTEAWQCRYCAYRTYCKDLKNHAKNTKKQ